MHIRWVLRKPHSAWWAELEPKYHWPELLSQVTSSPASQKSEQWVDYEHNSICTRMDFWFLWFWYDKAKNTHSVRLAVSDTGLCDKWLRRQHVSVGGEVRVLLAWVHETLHHPGQPEDTREDPHRPVPVPLRELQQALPLLIRPQGPRQDPHSGETLHLWISSMSLRLQHAVQAQCP